MRKGQAGPDPPEKRRPGPGGGVLKKSSNLNSNAPIDTSGSARAQGTGCDADAVDRNTNDELTAARGYKPVDAPRVVVAGRKASRAVPVGGAVRKFGDKSSFKPSRVRDVPPNEPFVMRSAKLLESPALRSLSRYARMMLDRFELEHCRHAGKENGYLVVTFDQFVEWGIARRFITRTVTELDEAKLLVVEHRGRGCRGRGDPSFYRLTYLKSKCIGAAGAPYYVEPSNDWETTVPPKVSKGSRSSGDGRGKNSFLGSRVVNRVSSRVVNPTKPPNGGNP